MKTKPAIHLLVLLAGLFLSACGGEPEAVPTLDVALIQTLAVGTFQAGLTQTAQVMPTPTPMSTNTPLSLATFTPLTGSVLLPSPTTAGGSAASCYNLTFAKDVTIPDNTPVTPGQSFTKTWLVLNSGSCAWEAGFIFNVVAGEAMSGAAVTLPQTVQPGTQYEFSVPMIAPTDKTGEMKGTWRLSDSTGKFFGDGVFVVVIVGNATAAPTATETPTPTP